MFFGVKNAKLGRKVYNLRPQTFFALKKICQQGTRLSTKNYLYFSPGDVKVYLWGKSSSQNGALAYRYVGTGRKTSEAAPMWTLSCIFSKTNGKHQHPGNKNISTCPGKQ